MWLAWSSEDHLVSEYSGQEVLLFDDDWKEVLLLEDDGQEVLLLEDGDQVGEVYVVAGKVVGCSLALAY